MDARTNLTPATPADLARRADLAVGGTTIRPSRRLVETSLGSSVIEPKVMQVLLALLDARGLVVTREDLIETCWGGRFVGVDAVNRAIAELRRELRKLGSEVTIETVPKVGYRAVTESLTQAAFPPAVPPPAAMPPFLSRRAALLAAGVVGLAGLAAGAGLWLGAGSTVDSAERIAEASRLLRLSMPGAGEQAIAVLRPVLSDDADNARAWATLALAHAYNVKNSAGDATTRELLACERAAQRALALEPREADALAALAVSRPFLGDWAAAEERLRAALAIAPDNLTALGELSLLYQSCGRCRLSLDLNSRALEIEPLSPMFQYRQAMKHWMFGDVARSDLTIDRALQLWPQHPAVWNARMMLFTLTDRPEGARNLLADRSVEREWLRPGQRKLWDVVLGAIEQREGEALHQAIAFSRRAISIGPGPSALMTMVMSHLGEIDQAFALSDAYLLRRGPLVPTLAGTGDEVPISDIRWRETLNLFTPATAAMRRDSRFDALCAALGMTEYWNSQGIQPDHKLGII